ncbi:MAG: peptidase T [Marinilabiliales bacterium]|nr:MAG: peptidase T [Marinilabiliales bacterium]
MKEKLLDRFLRYVSIDTQSDDKSDNSPSTEKQWKLAKLLVKELKEMGLDNAMVDDYAYVYASIPSNTDRNLPSIGFIAHMDTSPDMPGENVKAQVLENYDGKDIVLNKEQSIILKIEEYPELAEYEGHTIICTDGTTLLGADDKAGIAEIMTAVDFLLQNPEIEHGPVKIAFTTDEEIGRGTDYFDVERFGADFAYTMDGSGTGELEFENFNAASADIIIQGNNIHPGYAKDKMLNAIRVAGEFDALIPEKERPEYTEKYEGFYHLIAQNATVENATMKYIIRDHDRAKFELRKRIMEENAEALNEKYGSETVSMELKDQYFNMREIIENHYHVVDLAAKAMVQANIKPVIKPIRGGTDGARLSFMGLPCPNIFAGGHNFHGKYEYVSLEVMVKAVDVILNIIKLADEKE